MTDGYRTLTWISEIRFDVWKTSEMLCRGVKPNSAATMSWFPLARTSLLSVFYNLRSLKLKSNLSASKSKHTSLYHIPMPNYKWNAQTRNACSKALLALLSDIAEICKSQSSIFIYSVDCQIFKWFSFLFKIIYSS